MKLREILGRKGHDVVTIGRERSVLDAVQTLVQHNIGALLITQGELPEGIITERDVLRLTARFSSALSSTPVATAMTRDLVVAEPDDELHAMMEVMTKKRVRHLPVVEHGRLVGIVSIGDLLNACLDLAEDENSHLRQYIHGEVRPGAGRGGSGAGRATHA